MTYNVFGGTLNLAQLNLMLKYAIHPITCKQQCNTPMVVVLIGKVKFRGRTDTNTHTDRLITILYSDTGAE